MLAEEGFTCHACSVRLFRYYPFHLSFVSHATDFERHTYSSAGIKPLRSYHTVTVGWANIKGHFLDVAAEFFSRTGIFRRTIGNIERVRVRNTGNGTN